jgi:hypothetical protein
MELIFNELSLASPAPDRDTGHGWMQSLSETIRAAVDRGVAPLLRTCGNFWSTDLTPNYTLAHWSADRTVDRDLKRYIMTIAGKAPFIETLHGEAEDKAEAAAEFSWCGKRALGLGLAALCDHPAVSMSAEIWRKDPVVVHGYLETAEGPKEVEKEVRHWYDSATVKRRESCDWVRQQLGKEIVSGAQLLRKRKAILSRLDFTPDALRQMHSLTGAEMAFAYVVQHLLALGFQALDWQDGPFEAGYPYRCSEESKVTLQQYSSSRTFICADGVYRLFSWHSKINVVPWRIHFLPQLTKPRRVLIGYVGTHLPTVGDPH